MSLDAERWLLCLPTSTPIASGGGAHSVGHYRILPPSTFREGSSGTAS